jgi:hypothetical protein
MRHARRLIAILIGCATWCLAASSVAYAKIVDDVGPAGIPAGSSPESSGMPLWQFLAFMALGVLLAVAIAGLGYSLSHSRRSEPSPRSQTSLRS